MGLANREKGVEGQASRTTEQEQQWKTIQQIAARYQVSVRKVAYMMDEHTLPYYRIGRAIRFNPAECDQVMKAFRRNSRFDKFNES